MRFTCSDFESVRPVLNYHPPKYPTRAEAKQLGIELYRIPESVWARYGRSILAGALLLSIVNEGCFSQSCVRERHPGYEGVPEAERYLTEAQARQIVVDAFSSEGVVFTEDYQYTTPYVDFNADGYDPSQGIGFEYHSIDDIEEYNSLANDPAARDALFLDGVEEINLETQMNAGGDAVKKFVSGHSYSLAEEADYLQQQVYEFINWLKANGKL